MCLFLYKLEENVSYKIIWRSSERQKEWEREGGGEKT